MRNGWKLIAAALVCAAAVASEIEFAEREAAAPEGSVATLRLRRTGDTSVVASVSVRLKSGEAAHGVPNAFEFQPGQAEIDFALPTVENPLPEVDRQIELVLTNFVGSTAGANGSATVRVLDDDGRSGSARIGASNNWVIDESTVPDWYGSSPLRLMAMTVGKDGRTYVVARKIATSRMRVFQPSGEVDASFGEISDLDGVFGLGTQSDGKLLVAGEMRFLQGRAINSIGRLTPSGEFDATFRGLTGSAHGVYDFVVQPDQKIVLGGLLTDPTGNALVRLLKDGGNDPSFSLAPHRFELVTRVALQADGKILFSFARNSIHPDFVVARVHPNGTLDTGFQAQRGPTPVSFMPHALAVQPSGKILMGFGPEVRRLNSDGTPDADFKLGQQPDGYISEFVNLPDGKTLVAGTFKNIGGLARAGLARLNADGSVDASFDPGLGAEITHALLLPSGRYLVGGSFHTFNSYPQKTLVEVNSTLEPRFVVWPHQHQKATWFVGNLGSRVTIESSSDLATWGTFQTHTNGAYATPITSPAATGNTFLRARTD